eukprot:CAMPEP_0113488738 /NCGR_PEP_ID=MMETSP0014_2-20120614/26172_1 /TAXON_ID=2857 /ORGANISM="Nitzschia sp." /LENGTH=582 /DNA_ID=CAMNT_0000382461 /DNA_START=138 /DNA_END=1886 /DNA_ORIENTATION=+ /assembly_acc=CAM_ASM_000159
MRFAVAASILSTTVASSSASSSSTSRQQGSGSDASAILDVSQHGRSLLTDKASGGLHGSSMLGPVGGGGGRAGRRELRQRRRLQRRRQSQAATASAAEQHRSLLILEDDDAAVFDALSSDRRPSSVKLCNVQTTSSDAIDNNSSTASATNSDSDNDKDEDLVGILSCGPGQYCFPVLEMSWENHHDDDDSTEEGKHRPTGICVDKSSVSSSSSSSNEVQGQDHEQRLLQRDNNDPMIGQSLVARFCGGDTVAATERQQDGTATACDCSNVDFEQMTGTIDCIFDEVCRSIVDVCGNPVESCYTTTYDIDITSSTSYTYNYCYDYSSPVIMSACYTQRFVYTEPTGPVVGEDGTTTTTMNNVGSVDMVTAECEVGLYGTRCNSCRVVPKSADEPNTACFAMDCTNIPMMGPTALPRGVCEDEDVGSPLGAIKEKFLIYDLLPCPGGCNLCGEDGSYMNNKESTLVFPGTDFIYDCATLQVSALSGGLADLGPEYGNMCNKLSVAAHEPCECVDKDGNEIVVPPTLMPTVSAQPTMPPTEIPDAFNSIPGSTSGSSRVYPNPVVTATTVAVASLGAAAAVGAFF